MNAASTKLFALREVTALRKRLGRYHDPEHNPEGLYIPSGYRTVHPGERLPATTPLYIYLRSKARWSRIELRSHVSRHRDWTYITPIS